MGADRYLEYEFEARRNYGRTKQERDEARRVARSLARAAGPHLKLLKAIYPWMDDYAEAEQINRGTARGNQSED